MGMLLKNVSWEGFFKDFSSEQITCISNIFLIAQTSYVIPLSQFLELNSTEVV